MRGSLVVAAVVLVSMMVPVPAAAQGDAIKCDGDVVVVRLSQIKPTSSYEAFLKAQTAHIAWYRKNGFNDNQIYSSKTIVADPANRMTKYSDTEVLSLHVRPPSGNIVEKDKAGWDAYVKMYRDASDIKQEYRACMPKMK